jgi:hypothetical protein
MTIGRKIILFELNEVPFRVIDYYCQRHPDSFLARRLPECYQYETTTEDSVLSPWITWPTLQRGVTNGKHSIRHFGQDLSGIDRQFPPLWQILADRGIKTGVFGSLHTYPVPDSLANYAFYVPDTFAAGSECFPAYLSVFQEFNLLMARRSPRNVSTEVPWENALKVLLNIPRLGLRLETLLDIGRQLVTEKLKPWLKNRRRTYQVVLAFDLFLKQLQTTKPDFATFFTNHVASSMHRYWAATFPGDYENLGYDRDWVSRYEGEIDFAMSKFDRFFAELVDYVDRHREYTLWIATSMGQTAMHQEPLKTQLYATDLERFMSALGIPEEGWSRRAAMLPYVSILVEEEWAGRFREALSKLTICGQPMNFDEKQNGFFALLFGQKNLEKKQIDSAIFDGKIASFESLGLENIQIEDETDSTAYHIPQGSLIIYDPQDRSPKGSRTQISTLEITPTILKNFSIKVPDYMSDPERLSTAATVG